MTYNLKINIFSSVMVLDQGSLNMQRSMVTNCTGRFWDPTDRLFCLEQNLQDSVVNTVVSKWKNSLASPTNFTSMDVWYTYSYYLLQSVFGVFSQSKGTSSPVCDGQTTDSMKLNQGSGCTQAALPGWTQQTWYNYSLTHATLCTRDASG